MRVNTLSIPRNHNTEREHELWDCLSQLGDYSDIYIGDELPYSSMASYQMVVLEVKFPLKRTKMLVSRWDLVKNRYGSQIFGLTKREFEMIRRAQIDLKKVAVYGQLMNPSGLDR